MYGHHGTRWVRLEELKAFCERPGAEAVKKEVILADGVCGINETKSNNDSPRHMTPKDLLAIQHVIKQIAVLQRSDYNAAFEMNSPANQK